MSLKVKWRRGKPMLVLDTRPSRRIRAANKRLAASLKIQKRKLARAKADATLKPFYPACTVEKLAAVIEKEEEKKEKWN